MEDSVGTFGNGRRSWLRYVAGVGLAVVCGCGGAEQIENPVAEMTDDQKAVNSLVGSVSDLAAANLKQLRTVFTKEGAPRSSDVAKYKTHFFEIGGDIQVSGESATVPVQVGKYGSDVTKGATWKASKVDGRWLLSEAPIP